MNYDMRRKKRVNPNLLVIFDECQGGSFNHAQHELIENVVLFPGKADNR